MIRSTTDTFIELSTLPLAPELTHIQLERFLITLYKLVKNDKNCSHLIVQALQLESNSCFKQSSGVTIK